MKPSKIIRFISNQKNIPYNQIADQLGMQEQSLNNKLYRNNYKVSDLIKICEILDVDLCIRDRNNVYSLMEKGD
ncbi:hypothetical protein KEC48_03445 [Clostridium sp. C1]|uniref:hypothetical protein n=1 Tax=Clostridium sp. C1 TaxID=1155388 RepID=UPI001BA99CDD|nr:hypothetical protein [Clostridium sp. C1]QUN13594.1 hypothetical protein KEC48_03445 [Clostridium sp. C1]